MISDREEKVLIQAIKKDNHFSFKRVFDTYKSKVYHFALKFVLTDEYAEEITQIVFIKLWENRKKVREDTPLSPYLFVLTKNASLDFLRKISNDRALRDNFLNVYASLNRNETEANVHFNELKEFTQNAIEQLPPKQQKIYKLAKVEHKNYEEIAKIMSVSKNTVKTQLKIANESVKSYLSDKYRTVISLILFYMYCSNI